MESRAHEIQFTRLVDAPIEQVWEAWTNCEQMQKWWGPKEWTSPSCSIRAEEGGEYLLSMRAPEEQGGAEFYSGGTYENVVPLKHLTIRDHFADAEGHYIDPKQVGMPDDMPEETVMELEFEPRGHCTELKLKARGFTPGVAAEQFVQGMNESLDRLEESLGGQYCTAE